jgi:hypothetical protein
MASKREQWMSTKLAQCFNIEAENAASFLADNAKKVAPFLNDPKSPPKLFVYYQKQQFEKESLIMTINGEGEKLTGRVLYFIRNSNGKPVKTAIDNDAQVLCGELDAEILQNLKYTLEKVYNPYLVEQKEWGKIDQSEDKNAFIKISDKFGENLGRKIANLSGDVTLKVPDAPHDKIEQKPAAYARAAKDPEVLKHFRTIVESWCENITKYMENDPSLVAIDVKDTRGPEVCFQYCTCCLTRI